MSKQRPMAISLHPTCLIILIELVLSTHAQLVKTPLFYRNKTQRCNCDSNKYCDFHSGTCPNDKCARSYFGNNCQHANINLLMRQAPANVPVDLLDGDDTTCLKTWSGTAVFDLDQPVHFIWAYLYANTPITNDPRLVLSGQDMSRDKNLLRNLKLSENSLLIKTRNDVMFKKLELSQLPQDLCSLEISLGRNLAISSTPTIKRSRKNNAREFIDGNESNPSQQILQLAVEYWCTELLHDARINLIHIVGNLNDCQIWTINLEFTKGTGKKITQTHNKDDKTVYKDGDRTIVNINEKDLIRKLEFKVGSCVSHKPLALYEFYIFGEFLCLGETYGATCEMQCQYSCEQEQCDSDWGCLNKKKPKIISKKPKIISKCQGLFKYGEKCQFDCPDNCGHEGDCDGTTGACLQGCKQGYFTPKCTESCQPGHYGANCVKFCSFCKKNTTTGFPSCDPEYGHCYLGCDDDHFGDKCEQLTIRDPLYKVVGQYALRVLACLFVLYLMYRSFGLSEDASTTEEEEEEEGSSEHVDGKSFDAEDKIENGHKVLMEPSAANNKIKDDNTGKMHSNATEKSQPKPIEITKPKPIEVTQPKPVEIIQPKPKEITQPKPIEITQPKPIEITQPKPTEITQPKPVEITQPKPAEITQPKPAEITQPKPTGDHHPLDQSAETSTGVLKSTDSDSASLEEEGSTFARIFGLQDNPVGNPSPNKANENQ